MSNQKNFDEVLRRTNLAFSKSPTKGIIFWYNILLSDSETNTQLNEKAWEELKATFAEEKPDQNDLIEQVIADLRYIRKQTLGDETLRRKVEVLKNFLMQNMVSEDVIDSLQEYVFKNYDKVKSELEKHKK